MTCHLGVGDYDLGHGVVVERKTILDLHESIRQGRFWAQIGRLRRASRLPYLLIEGQSIDTGPLGPDAIRSACLAVIGQGVPVLRTVNVTDSACWLHLLAFRVDGSRPGRDRPVYAQRLKPPGALVREAMLAAVPGISVQGARALLARFETVAGVVSAGYDEWLTVPGVGPSRAASLRDALL